VKCAVKRYCYAQNRFKKHFFNDYEQKPGNGCDKYSHSLSSSLQHFRHVRNLPVSGWALASSNQSCHFWALGNRDVNNASQTFIQKYSDKSNKPIAEFLVDGGSSASSVSQDGLRLALFMENTVSIFDESLRLEKQISIDEMGFGESTLFLNNGEFLVTNTSGIQIIKLSGNIEASPITEEGLFCTIDTSESFLAVGKGQYNRLTQDNTVGIYKFPEFDLLIELKYKGHTLKRPRISSDGKKVACEANRLHGDRKSVVLFDVESGELIAEYKSDDICVKGVRLVFQYTNHTQCIEKLT